MVVATGLMLVAADSEGAEVVNQAQAAYLEASATVPSTLDSNSVSATVRFPAPRIQFFTDASFSRRAFAADMGQPLYVQVWAASCRGDAVERDPVTVTFRADASQDTETFTAWETDANSGVFRVMDPVLTEAGTGNGAARRVGPDSDELIESRNGDYVNAMVSDCDDDTLVWDRILIDPTGTVFDSETNMPVRGARVRLIDVTGAGNGGRPGEAATVLDFDGVSAAPSEVTTEEDGRYQFPLVASSRYRLAVVPPGDYTFPSTRPMDYDFADDRTLIAPGSWGMEFEVDATTASAMFDVPVDARPDGIVLQLTAARHDVELGETVSFRLVVRNISGVALDDVRIRAALPAGFTLVPGSVRLDGVALSMSTKGPIVEFDVGALDALGQREITYRAFVGAGALEGDGLTRARAHSDTPARKLSNWATATVDVAAGVFDDRGFVLGRVFADCNADRSQTAGEPGVPGVRLYLEDGTSVVTDSRGAYSFYGVTPRTHVLKVDPTSLPEGATLSALSNRHAGSGNTSFVDVQRGELHRTDFALTGCDATQLDIITARKARLDAQAASELDASLRVPLSRDASDMALGDIRALAASGTVNERWSTASGSTAALDAPIAASSVTKNPANALARTNEQSLASRIATLDSKLDFLDVQDGAIATGDHITVRAKGAARAVIELRVNDVIIGESLVGTRVSDTARGVEVREYFGVELERGVNRLELYQRDVGGNVRAHRLVHVSVASELSTIRVQAPTTAIADATRRIPVVVSLLDDQDIPVPGQAFVTLEASAGIWQVDDLDPREPGTQIRVIDGRAMVQLQPPATPVTARVRVTHADMDAETDVAFTAALRPMIAAGVLEGLIDLRNLDAGALSPARRDDGFERELRAWSTQDGDVTAAARAALFLKGKVRGDYLLTLAYDSDKDTRERLFRDIQPDQFYPVYGDDGTKAYDAQSSGRLYVRVDRNRSWLLAGDYSAPSLSKSRSLSSYRRSSTGVVEHYEVEGFAVEAFATQDDARRIVEEFRANGTSGPFFLARGTPIENSEQVEILVRDRDQPAVIKATVPQQRFTDYDIEPLTGRLLFRSPIASVDPNLDPRSIRVTYDVEGDGEEFWTAGFDSRWAATDRLELGASLVDEDDPMNAFRVAGTTATYRLAEKSTVIAEVAHAESDVEGRGWARRVELLHDGARMQLRAHADRSDEAFVNPSANLAAGRSEAGAKLAYSVGTQTRLLVEGLHTAALVGEDRRDGALVGIERRITDTVKIEAGVRHVQDEYDTDGSDGNVESQTDHTTSARTKVTSAIPYVREGSMFAEYEQDVSDADGRLFALGGDYPLASRGRVYARHELLSSLSGPYALDPDARRNTTVFGIETDYLGDDHLFSEYRLGNGLSGREAQAALGLRNGWRVARGLKLDTSFERIEPLAGDGDDESAAVTGALSYTRNPRWKGTTRLELSSSDSSDGLLSTLGVASRINEDWTFLGKNVFALTHYDSNRANREQHRLQLGVAHRDSDANRTNLLARYEFKTEQGVELGLDRTVHIVSTHADRQFGADTVLRGQYAVKFAQEAVDDLRMNHTTQLVGARVTRDLDSRWDAGLHVRTLISEGTQFGAGVELGRVLKDDLWLSLGWNAIGFRDDDLADSEYTRRGVYVRLRFKFDETSFIGAGS